MTPRPLALLTLLALAACGGDSNGPDQPTLVSIEGQGASAFAGNFTPELPLVQVRNAAGDPVAGVTVTFTVTQGGGTVAFPGAVSNAEGFASPGAWRFGAAGTQRLEATADGYATASFQASAVAPPAASFDIDLRFLDPQPTAAQRAAFEAARDRWEQIILGDVPNFSGTIPADPCGDSFTLPAVTPPVDDIVVFAGVQAIDQGGGILAQAGPCLVRSNGRLPIVGIVVFDVADLGTLTSAASLTEVAFHEIAHALGLGTLWTDLGLLAGAGTSDPYFTGTTARQAFAALQDPGAPFTGNSVPVEGTGGAGTRDGHWRESVFDNEIMTGFYDGGTTNLLSAMTIASLRDMGYAADDTRGDAYALDVRLARLVAGTATGTPLAESLAPWPIVALDDAGRPVPGRSRP